MSEISPNPDTPLVNAYGYNFGKRVRQPGGRRLRVCREDLSWPLLAPGCQCAVFDNWGRPDALSLACCGWTMQSAANDCGSNCGALNTSTCNALGQGPFTLSYLVDDGPQLINNSNPPRYAGGGIEHILPANAFAASGDGYSCTYQYDGLPISDVCGSNGAVSAQLVVGYDTTAGTFAQLYLIGESGIIYYCWTWLLTGVPPGKLDCSGNGPAIYHLTNLLGGVVGEPNPTNIVSAGATVGTRYNYEFGANDNQTQQCGPFALPWLCYGCDNPPSGFPPGNYPGTQAGATVSVTCAGDGTNEVAPPCCCGGPGKCLVACFGATGPCAPFAPHQLALCLSGGKYAGDGVDSNGDPISASLSYSGGSWTMDWSCSGGGGSHTFSGPEVGQENGKLCLYAQGVGAGGCCSSNLNISVGCHQDNCFVSCPCCGANKAFDLADPAEPPAEVQVTIPDLVVPFCGCCCAPGEPGGGTTIFPSGTFLCDAVDPWEMLGGSTLTTGEPCMCWRYDGTFDTTCYGDPPTIVTHSTVPVLILVGLFWCNMAGGAICSGGDGSPACFWNVYVRFGIPESPFATYSFGSSGVPTATFAPQTVCEQQFEIPFNSRVVNNGCGGCPCPPVTAGATVEWEPNE